MKPLFVCLQLFLLGTLMGHAQPRIRLNNFANGFVRPVDISHAGDDRLFVTEQRGKIFIVQANGTVLDTPFLDIQSQVRSSGSEQGLLGLTFHPNYDSTGYFYVNYIKADRGTQVSRFKVDPQNPNRADPNSEFPLLSYTQPFNNHNGGDLNFGPNDGYLYISSGDGGSGGDPQDNGQKGITLLGKILRIDVDSGNPYSIPADNPFVSDPNVLDEIWSLGWRNPWRFSFDRANGDMWIADVGQNAREEISYEPASMGGLNYGWRCLEASRIFDGRDCGMVSDYVQPIFEYAHSFTRGSSITGGYVYRGDNYPALKGHYVFGDYNSGQFWTIYENMLGLSDTTEQGPLLARDECSTFGEDIDGELYVASLGDGIIYKIEETTNSIDPLTENGSVYFAPHPLTDQITLSFDNPTNQQHTLFIRDIKGRTIRKIEDIRSSSVVLDRGNLTPGVYIVEINGKRRFIGKMLVN